MNTLDTFPAAPTCPHCGDAAHYFEGNDPLPTCDACGKSYALDTETPTAAPSVFSIDSTDRANWLLRKLANLDTEKTRVKAQAEAILRQLDTDREGLLYLYGSQLEAFTRQELAKTGNRRKSLTLLQGTCGFRTVPARMSVTDAAAALDYAKANLPEAVKTLETLDPAAYRKRAEETGELLPGLVALPSQEAFSVKFSGKGGTE